jgi:hypothetical protein
MSYLIELVLFIVVLGAIDARLPWPKPTRDGDGK